MKSRDWKYNTELFSQSAKYRNNYLLYFQSRFLHFLHHNCLQILHTTKFCRKFLCLVKDIIGDVVFV